jgi:hypothetical protein
MTNNNIIIIIIIKYSLLEEQGLMLTTLFREFFNAVYFQSLDCGIRGCGIVFRPKAPRNVDNYTMSQIITQRSKSERNE